MDTQQLMWAANSLLVVVLGFFIKMWIDDLKKSITKLQDEKVDVKTCKLFHESIGKKVHSHGSLGQAGEVIL
jgi:hypothetical protein